MIIELAGTKLELLKEKAVWEESTRSLFLSDTHFGKASHFRKAGIPVSESVHMEDFRRLKSLIVETGASEVFLLGDLFHSDWNRQWDVLTCFFQSLSPTRFHLIKGNHDILHPMLYESPTLNVHTRPLRRDGLVLSHEPLPIVESDALNLCGHLHPGVVLRGKGRQSLRLPCYILHERRLILPAFGSFTGLMTLNTWKDKEVFVVTPGEVIPMKFPNKVG